jgi:hypothetical protein
MLKKAEEYLLYRMRVCVDAKETQGDSSFTEFVTLEFPCRYFVDRSLDEEWVFTPTNCQRTLLPKVLKAGLTSAQRKWELVRI